MFDNVTTDMPTDVTTAAGITATANGPITSSRMTTITLPTDIPTIDPLTIESTTCKYVRMLVHCK